MNPKLNLFFNRQKKWKEEYIKLREILLACGLAEEFKWMHPCYTYQDANIVLIHGFKDYCALLFFKGVLMSDKKGILIQQTKNVQDRRQIRFTQLDEIVDMEPTIKAYVAEAVKIEKAGLKAPLKKTADYELVEELRQKFKSDPAFKAAFKALTPGRQRGYLLYFAQPKQSKTRVSRIEKYTSAIFAGKGLTDR